MLRSLSALSSHPRASEQSAAHDWLISMLAVILPARLHVKLATLL